MQMADNRSTKHNFAGALAAGFGLASLLLPIESFASRAAGVGKNLAAVAPVKTCAANHDRGPALYTLPVSDWAGADLFKPYERACDSRAAHLPSSMRCAPNEVC